MGSVHWPNLSKTLIMQLGTFQGFASIPSGDSWSSGAAIGQRIGEAAMQYDMDRQKLASQMAIANMEASAKSAALQAESARAAQELEVRKACGGCRR